jgi:hypothetical protein
VLLDLSNPSEVDLLETDGAGPGPTRAKDPELELDPLSAEDEDADEDDADDAEENKIMVAVDVLRFSHRRTSFQTSSAMGEVVSLAPMSPPSWRTTSR